jgi:SAM-dependent methyltransferase
MAERTPTGHCVCCMDWEEAGRGWGARALEWAYLLEPYTRPANDVLFDQLDVGADTRLLDVACGSGFAANVASRRGAAVAGLDASAALIEIAQARTPEGDFRIGNMFALPFDDGGFDVVTSFNGIWNGCEGALGEAHRVLHDGGRIGLTYWGRYERLGLMPYFLKVIELSPPSHQSATMEQGETRTVIEAMLQATQFRVLSHGTIDVVNEWPDVATAVRALAAAGPSVPAIESIGYDGFCQELHDVLAPLHDPGTGIRICSEFGWITGQRI